MVEIAEEKKKSMVMDRMEFISRLKSLILPPGQNQALYFGVSDDNSVISSTLWSEFMAKTFMLKVGTCSESLSVPTS